MIPAVVVNGMVDKPSYRPDDALGEGCGRAINDGVGRLVEGVAESPSSMEVSNGLFIRATTA